MRSKKIIFTLLITTMFLIPFIDFAAAATPNYVGIQEGDEIIWDVLIDDDPIEDYLEDAGYPEVVIDNYTDDVFDDAWDKDIVGWKIKILELEKEDDDDGDDYVEYDYRFYIKEEDEDWEVDDQKDSDKIWKYDTDKYVDLASASTDLGWYWYIFNHPYGSGLFRLVVSDNVKWGKLAEELDDELDDDFDGNDESAGAEAATDMYFFMQRENGLSTYANKDEEDFDDFTSTAQFNGNGVLLYYNWAYDGDTIIELKLQYRMVYQWWWAAVIALAAVVIIIMIIVIKRR